MTGEIDRTNEKVLTTDGECTEAKKNQNQRIRFREGFRRQSIAPICK